MTAVTRGTNTFGYGYDASSNVTSRTYPDSTQIAYSYDEDNRLASVASGGATTTYTYDPASHLTQTTLPSGNGYVEARTYDAGGRLTEVKNAKGATTLSDFVSTLDNVGNPTQIVQSGAVASTTAYGYDNMDRLTSVCFQAGSCPGASDPFIRWTYDSVGNRLTEERPGVALKNYTYNALDELTQAGTTTYTYDQNGNERTAGSTTFTYDLVNRLKTLTSGTTTTTYSYDGDGVRLQASTGAQANKKTNFLWDSNAPLAQLALERDGNNNLLRRYQYGHDLVSMRSGNSDSYYHYDSIGSVRNVTSSSGASQWTETYEPFGTIRTETKNQTSAPANLMKFTGEYADPTGLYHLRARQYDPATGRFLQADPLEPNQAQPSVGAQVYVADRPTVAIDPSGQIARPSTTGACLAFFAASPGATSGSQHPEACQGQVPVLGSCEGGGNRYLQGSPRMALSILTIAKCRAVLVCNPFCHWAFECDTAKPPDFGTPIFIELPRVNIPPLSAGARGRWSCKARCSVYNLRTGDTTYIEGTGRGSSERDACQEAKSDANRRIPPGFNKRHCRCYDCVKR